MNTPMKPKFKLSLRTTAIVAGLTLSASGSSCAWLSTRPTEVEGSEFEGDPIAAAAWQIRMEGPLRLPASASEVTSANGSSVPAFYAGLDEDSIAAHQAQVDRGRREANIVLGMGPADVRRAWGTPLEVQDSGERAERWIYPEGFAYQHGGSVQRQRRVYFEDGRVSGWDTVRPGE